MRSTPQYALSGLAARSLFKRPEASVVLVVLARGKALKQHHVAAPVSIQTLEGRVSVHAPDRSLQHVAGGLALLDSGVAHSVEARADSAILLTMPWPDPR